MSEPEIEIVPEQELYPWTDDNKEKRRCFAYEYFNWNNDISAKIQIEALGLIDKWLSGQ